MRKFLAAILIVFAGIAAYEYRDSLGLGREHLQDIAQSISQSGALEGIKQEVFTSGPLRGGGGSAAASLTRSGTIEQTNVQRAANGAAALKENALLNRAAELKLRDMFARQYFEHSSPDGKGPGDLAGTVHYEYIAVGENLALGNYKDDQVLVQAWMDSPGHRDNILNSKFLEIGVAVDKGMFEGKMTWLAVQEFGRPVSACPGINQALQGQISSFKAELSSLEAQISGLRAYLENNKPQGKKETEEYNQKVGEYNSMVKSYNNKLDLLKQAISQYNEQVKAYNFCLTE